jgi:hypothetical protein
MLLDDASKFQEKLVKAIFIRGDSPGQDSQAFTDMRGMIDDF